MNALELADILDRSVLALSADAAAELRRLYEVNQELLRALGRILAEPNETMSDGKALKEIVRISRAAIKKAEGKA